ncbi:MAG: response regulator transcription factor [Lachnospiraceae bacterium]|nr:response regulator transcription factor [Lachnospiraceae bacterium]
MDKRVMIVQKSGAVVQRFGLFLESQGFDVVTCFKGWEQDKVYEGAALWLYELEKHGEGVTGIEDLIAVKKLRSATDKPIIVYGSGMEEMTMISMLNAGADDCVTDTCGAMELLARVNSQIRRYDRLRGSGQPMRVLKIGELEIDDISKTVLVEGRSVNMTPMEYKILYLLAKKRGKVLSTKQIYEQVWNMKPIGADNTVAVHVRHIREKIEQNPQNPRYLQVVWGQGYKVG